MVRIIELHSYDTPKVIALAPDAVNATYLAWVVETAKSLAPRDLDRAARKKI